MLTGLGWLVGATALLAGVTGAWSPCGFSMVDTLGAAARESGRRVLPPACATFTAGSVAGGAALYGGLAALGALLGAHAGGAAVAIAGAAALAELLGVRIRPQVRRQVPEPWRRTLPLPLAAGLYGVLLGLGFATFVLTLAVVALAAVCLALGDPALGLVAGAGFGLGRALPVVALAPLHGTAPGVRALELMAERPGSLRGLRAADGLALAACAVAIGTGAAYGATRSIAAGATDPSVAGHTLAWQREGGAGRLWTGGRAVTLPGTDPALGGPYVAWRRGDRITVADRATLRPLRTLTVPRLGKLAVSGRWLAWRRDRRGGGDVIGALPLGRPGRARVVSSVHAPAQLGRPDLDGDRLVYHIAGPRGSAIRELNLRTHRRLTLLRSRAAQLLNPAIYARALVYVVVSRCGQRLVLRRHGHTRTLARGRALAGQDAGFDRGHTDQGSRRPCRSSSLTHTMMWSTALSRRFAYLTLVPLAGGRSRIVRTPL